MGRPRTIHKSRSIAKHRFCLWFLSRCPSRIHLPHTSQETLIYGYWDCRRQSASVMWIESFQPLPWYAIQSLIHCAYRRQKWCQPVHWPPQSSRWMIEFHAWCIQTPSVPLFLVPLAIQGVCVRELVPLSFHRCSLRPHLFEPSSGLVDIVNWCRLPFRRIYKAT